MLKWPVTACALAMAFSVPAETADITIRHAPHVVSSVSSKSEKDWATCKYCGSKTSYYRTYKWDVYNHQWNETTEQDKIPVVCRQCQRKERDQEKLDRRERELDRQIEYQKTRIRISDKEREVRRLRKTAR